MVRSIGICDRPSLRAGLLVRIPLVVVARRTPFRFLTAFFTGAGASLTTRAEVFLVTLPVGFFFATAFFFPADFAAAFFFAAARGAVFLVAAREADFLVFVDFFFVAFFFAIEFRPSGSTSQTSTNVIWLESTARACYSL